MTLGFRADLHCHSTFSDGTDTPAELIEKAVQIGLSGLSITDHDTTEAYQVALPVAKAKGLMLLSGVEFSAAYREEPVHILAYGYNLASPSILELCARHTERRQARNLAIVENLHSLGIMVKPLELHHQGSWGRPHIAQAMVNLGVVQTVQEAFEVYLGEGKPAYDPGEPVSVEETIAIIHAGQGKAVLAHPHLLKRSTTIRAMLAMPFDGLECYYARLGPSQEKKWIDLARQRGWLITGGSDYHGLIKPQTMLGASWVGRETFELLYNHFLSVN